LKDQAHNLRFQSIQDVEEERSGRKFGRAGVRHVKFHLGILLNNGTVDPSQREFIKGRDFDKFDLIPLEVLL